ncbi:MAG: TRAP transporter small permease subunit [Rhodospirillum sp.]|nr:TRAP transporter small permease subunit [Rhodospirillum sp.]MCF8491503.1 TRAP transporter small permease subunit [Rhodospirillum sp.]
MSLSGNSKGEAGHASSALGRVAMALSATCGALAVGLILVVLGVTAVSVVMRYLVNAPLLGTDEATGFLVVGIVMLGAAEVHRTGDHLRIDLLFASLAPGSRRILDGLANGAVLVFALILCDSAWDTVMFSRDFGAYSSGHLEMPLWIPQSFLVAGAALLALVALAKILDILAGRNPP